jgi:uncharacterized membrane protein
MIFLRRFTRGELRLNRIEALTDGVFAIIVTLLVLELRVPALGDVRSPRELADGLIAGLPTFVSWMLSFIILCKFWLNHHHVLAMARHANYALVWMNSIFLMLQSFVPFPTAMIGQYPQNPLAVSFFGVVMAVNTIFFVYLQAYIVRHLVRPELAHLQDPRLIRNSAIGPLSYLLGAALAWVNVVLAFAVYFITPLFFIVPPPLKEAPAAAESTADMIDRAA